MSSRFGSSPRQDHKEPEVEVRLENVTEQAPPSIDYLLHEVDHELLKAVQDNDDKKLKSILARKEVDLNCLNALGQTPLQIAVLNKSTKLIQILLQHGADIGNSLLQAVADESLGCVQVLIEFQEKQSTQTRDCPQVHQQSETSAQESENNYVTPVILAAKNNSYDIVKFLLSKGYFIDDSDLHSRACDCSDCEAEGRLGCSLRRLNVYRGLSSHVYLSLSHLMKPTNTSDTKHDPILQAFVLNKKLLNLAKVEYEFKSEYLSLSEQCEDYAISLLNQCRNMSEIQQLMDVPMMEEMQFIKIKGPNDHEVAKKLSVLNFAIKNNNQKFVAHSYSQMMLNSVLYSGVRRWESFSPIIQIVVFMLYTALMPIWSLLYIFSPSHVFSQKLNSPLLKFLGHTGSFCLFLALLLLSVVQDIFFNPLQASLIDILLILWIVGLTFQEAKEVYRQGRQRYFSQFWNIVTLVMLSCFIIAGFLWLVGYLLIMSDDKALDNILKEVIDKTTRVNFEAYQLILVSNTFFALGFVLAFFHISNAFQVNSVMGPLQLSLIKMTRDILKFLFLLLLIYVAFGGAFRKVYSQFVWVRRTFGNETSTDHGFSSLFGSMRLTFWAMFDKTELSEFATGDSFPSKITQNTGEVLFALFNIATILVAINMLIAMMSNSYQSIEDNSDVHWKFSRTKMWMQFILKGSVLPPPFNLLPTVQDVARFFQRCTKRCGCTCCVCIVRDRGELTADGSSRAENKTVQKRDLLINHLIQRHFYQLEKDQNNLLNTEPVSHCQHGDSFSTHRLRESLPEQQAY